MIAQNTDLFAYVDNFAKIEGTELIKVFGCEDSSVEYTIAIPTCKRTEHLKEAINSALNQDCSFAYNVIVVDNNPERDDDTEMMMASYKNTKNLSYYKNAENLGMAGNWNRLFQLAKTKWVVMLHDDDMLFPYYLRRINDFANKFPSLSLLNAGKVYWNGKDKIIKEREDKRIYKFDKYTNFPFFMFGAPTGCLFNTEDVRKIGGFDPTSYPSIDYVFVQKMCLSGKEVYATKEKLMYYRVGENTSSKADTQILWLEKEYKIRQELAEILKIPNFIRDFVILFEMKWRLRLLNRLIPNYTFLHYTAGNKFWGLLYGIYYSLARRIMVKKIK